GRRDGTAARGWVLGPPERLAGEPHAYHPHAQSEHALEMLVVRPGKLDVGELLEAEHRGEEVDRPIHVGHGHADGIDAANERRSPGVASPSYSIAGTRQQQDE